MECAGTILVFVKFSYFLSLFDAIAPLIDTIWRVFVDIVYFVVVLLISFVVFGTCFYLVGQNQIQFSGISPSDLI